MQSIKANQIAVAGNDGVAQFPVCFNHWQLGTGWEMDDECDFPEIQIYTCFLQKIGIYGQMLKGKLGKKKLLAQSFYRPQTKRSLKRQFSQKSTEVGQK